MAQMNRIKVVIDGVIYELSSGESVEYIQSVANYIDRKIKNIYSVKSEGAINPSLRTLFISLNIADDLYKEREKVKELEREASSLRKEIATLKEKNEKLSKAQSTPKAETKPEIKLNTNNKPVTSNTPTTNNTQTHQKHQTPVTNNNNTQAQANKQS